MDNRNPHLTNRRRAPHAVFVGEACIAALGPWQVWRVMVLLPKGSAAATHVSYLGARV